MDTKQNKIMPLNLHMLKGRYNLTCDFKTNNSSDICICGLKGLSQQTANMCITCVQCRSNVSADGPTLYNMLYKCFVFKGTSSPPSSHGYHKFISCQVHRQSLNLDFHCKISLDILAITNLPTVNLLTGHTSHQTSLNFLTTKAKTRCGFAILNCAH